MNGFRDELLQADAMNIPFPTVLPEVHAGIPLGNGIAGALVWFDRGKLSVTFNRSDYWDRRGSLVWSEDMEYSALVDLLHAGNAAEVVRRFRKPDLPDIPERPTRLPMGRVELDLPDMCRVLSARLELMHGRARIELAAAHAQTCTVQVSMQGTDPVIVVETHGDFSLPVRAVPSNPPSATDGYATAAWRLEPPVIVEKDVDRARWTQGIPGGSYLAVEMHSSEHTTGERKRKLVQIACMYAETAEGALDNARRKITRNGSFDALAADTIAFWHRFWESCALVRTDNLELDRQYLMGMYRLGASSVEGLDATGLQGPWIEDHRMPPWSGDFHLNVNIQECYWPSFSGNCMSAARALVDFVLRHEPVAKRYARYFANVEDGYHLPHAIDDTGACMGGFWTGSIDHGSTAWLVHTVVEYCRYAHRVELYRDIAVPLLCKVLRVSSALLATDEAGQYSYKVSVSPELGGAGENAWGANASYQLSAVHACARDIRFSIRMCTDQDVQKLHSFIPDLDEIRSFAECVETSLPPFARAGMGDNEPDEILVFDGQPLAHSHRHHSHLVGLWPLQTIDPEGVDAAAVRYSLKRWVRLGCGEWSGWSFPWASIIQSHTGAPDAALQHLMTVMNFFRNEGYATTHDARHSGITVLDGRPDIMQLEAGLGFSAAVLELIVRTDSHWWSAEDLQHLAGYHIATDVPLALGNVTFSRIRLPGAICADGEIRDHRLVNLQLESENDCTIQVTIGSGRERRVIRLKGRQSVRVV